MNEIWRELESRNIRTPFQQGFIQREVFAFDERSIREAVLNAVTHRDYSISGQVIFITASPDGFLIESPGGFLPGITPKNVIFSRAWRNQRLAEVFEKAGLVERSGQGLDLIFEQVFWGRFWGRTILFGCLRHWIGTISPSAPAEGPVTS